MFTQCPFAIFVSPWRPVPRARGGEAARRPFPPFEGGAGGRARARARVAAFAVVSVEGIFHKIKSLLRID